MARLQKGHRSALSARILQTLHTVWPHSRAVSVGREKQIPHLLSDLKILFISASASAILSTLLFKSELIATVFFSDCSYSTQLFFSVSTAAANVCIYSLNEALSTFVSPRVARGQDPAAIYAWTGARRHNLANLALLFATPRYPCSTSCSCSTACSCSTRLGKRSFPHRLAGSEACSLPQIIDPGTELLQEWQLSRRESQA